MAHENATPKHWSAETNSNYARDPLAGWIVRYDPKPIPTKNADGTTTLSLNFPALAVTAWVGDPERAAKDVADALNEHGTLRAENERLLAALDAISGLRPDDSFGLVKLMADIADAALSEGRSNA